MGGESGRKGGEGRGGGKRWKRGAAQAHYPHREGAPPPFSASRGRLLQRWDHSAPQKLRQGLLK